MNKLFTTLLLLSGTSIEGFVAPQPSTTSTILHAKGFGSSKETPSSSSKKQPASSSVTSEPVQINQDPDASLLSTATTAPPTSDLSQGKAALEKLRRERAEQRNAELRKVKEVQDVDAMLRESPGAAVIPERVAQRMGKRMLPFVGIPIFGTMGSFVGFWYMATYRDMEYQPALVAASSIALLVASLLVRSVTVSGTTRGLWQSNDRASEKSVKARQGPA